MINTATDIEEPRRHSKLRQSQQTTSAVYTTRKLPTDELHIYKGISGCDFVVTVLSLSLSLFSKE